MLVDKSMMNLAGRHTILLFFAFSLLVLPYFSSNAYYVSLQFWWFNSENLQLNHLSFNLRITQDDNVQMSVITEFNLHGTQQSLKFWIDCYPLSSAIHWGDAVVKIRGSFLEINGSRSHSDTYNNTLKINPEAIISINRTQYFLDFTDEILKVQRELYPEESPENCGVYGHLVFENTIYDIIGQIETKRYIKLSLHVNSNSQYPWLLFPIIKLPSNADWIKAKIGAEDMAEIFPDQRESTITVMPSSQTDSQIYAVWEMPSPKSWQETITQFPLNLFWSFLTGVLTTLFCQKFLFSKKKKEEDAKKIELAQSDAGKEKHQISNILLWIFYVSGFVFISSNAVTLLSNLGFVSEGTTNLVLILEVTGLLLSIFGLSIIAFYAMKRKNALHKIFREVHPIKRLDLKVWYTIMLTINTLGGIVFQKSLLFLWVTISLAFLYVRFSIDEFIKESNRPDRIEGGEAAMSDCDLLLVNIKQISKASRLFRLFKPKESINWEPFDLHITFKNNNEQPFEGGKCNFIIKGVQSEDDFDVDIPSMDPKEVKTITCHDLIIAEAGFIAVTRLRIESKEGKKVLCKDEDGKDTSRPQSAYPLYLATREELYQKYAIVVALFFSIFASILTVINVIVAILK